MENLAEKYFNQIRKASTVEEKRRLADEFYQYYFSLSEEKKAEIEPFFVELRKMTANTVKKLDNLTEKAENLLAKLAEKKLGNLQEMPSF
jgi:hypothetical protein